MGVAGAGVSRLNWDLNFFVGGYWAYGATDKLISLIIWGYFCFLNYPGGCFLASFWAKKRLFAIFSWEILYDHLETTFNQFNGQKYA